MPLNVRKPAACHTILLPKIVENLCSVEAVWLIRLMTSVKMKLMVEGFNMGTELTADKYGNHASIPYFISDSIHSTTAS